MVESAFGKTDVGRVRDNNEDAYLLLREQNIYLVSDGMGGQNAGEVASAQAVAAVKAFFADKDLVEVATNDIGALLTQAMTAAHNTVMDLGRKEARYSDMGCTLVIALIRDQALYVCHSGDSRAYVINSETISQVTTDHSVVMELVGHGALSMEEARISPLKNQITQGVGLYRFEPECSSYELRAGDMVLLCSDGLWDMLMDAEIHALVIQGGSTNDICTRLIDAANASGGEDNITVVLVKQEE